MTAFSDLVDELGSEVILVAISKTKSPEKIMEVYDQGHRDFGENKVQELEWKEKELPKDIKWHYVGHLQRNKVKYLAPFVHLIHSVDSLRLAREIDKQGAKNNRIISVLIQAHIADEESKFGIPLNDMVDFVKSLDEEGLSNICIRGLMGMATNSPDQEKIQQEFESLNQVFLDLGKRDWNSDFQFEILSMGMSGDYDLALKSGSNMVRIGTRVFGPRGI